MRLVQGLLGEQGWIAESRGTLIPTRPLIAWFYMPMPGYFLDHLPIQVMMYDVMDELANFQGAAPDVQECESWLLKHADLVFAGGRSLYAARKGLHSHVHLFPSRVDVAYFAQALDAETAAPPEIAHLPRPVLGYYGVDVAPDPFPHLEGEGATER